MHPTDRRRHPRRAAYLPAVVQADSGRTVRTHATDVSLGGAVLACVGLEGDVTVALKLPSCFLRIAGTVVRHEPGRTALRWGRLSSEERMLLGRFVVPERAAA